MRIVLVLLLLKTLLLPVEADERIKKINLATSWYPQAQYAGFYVAADKGFYLDDNLEVNFIHGDFRYLVEKKLTDSIADFGIMWLHEGMMAHRRNSSIVHIAQFFQGSSILLTAKKSKIPSMEKLDGKSIGIWKPFVQVLSGLLRFNGVSDLEIVPVRDGVELLLMDAVDAAMTMRYNEYHQILMSGMDEEELFVYPMGHCGVSLLEDGIYCRREFYESKREVCRAFLEASMKGWKYALENIDETVDICMRYIRANNLKDSECHQRWMLNVIKEEYFPSGTGNINVTLAPDALEKLNDFFIGAGLADSRIDYNEFHKRISGE